MPRLDAPAVVIPSTFHDPHAWSQYRTQSAFCSMRLVASGLSGRRLKSFKQRFSTHRRLLLERLDPSGPVNELSCWRRFDEDLRNALDAL